jgi:hypothetical protein
MPPSGQEEGRHVPLERLQRRRDAGHDLTETVTMPETNFTITQGTMTVTELGNSVPYTGKLDDLSELPVKEIISKVLKNDARRRSTSPPSAIQPDAKLRVVPTAAQHQRGDADHQRHRHLTNNVALGKNHVKAIVDLMKERNIPPYMADDYIAIAHPSTSAS